MVKNGSIEHLVLSFDYFEGSLCCYLFHLIVIKYLSLRPGIRLLTCYLGHQIWANYHCNYLSHYDLFTWQTFKMHLEPFGFWTALFSRLFKRVGRERYQSEGT